MAITILGRVVSMSSVPWLSALDDRVVHIADGLHARLDQLALLVAHGEHPVARWLQEDEHALESQPVGFHVSVSLGERRLPILE